MVDRHSGILAETDRFDDRPLIRRRPRAAATAARYFLDRFPGEVFYAVKCNPSPWLIRAFADAGVRAFDVASLPEVRAVRDIAPQARLAYMHPVKSRRAVAEAYFEHGVRIFALDHESELDKIMAATGGAKDLTLVVRLAVSNTGAALPLTGKFGADEAEAPALLLAARRHAERLGASFHVGSQTGAPDSYRTAMGVVDAMVRASGAWLDVVDVGGGFPAAYEGQDVAPLDAFMRVIDDTFEEMLVKETCELWCEPGRALAAETESVVLQVELRKGDRLYVNDGAYGSLFDAAHLGQRHPVRVLGPERGEGEWAPFRLYGPTCDSIDEVKTPILLPADIGEGDRIEIGQMGAYGAALATGFNGFGDYAVETTEEPPLLTMFGETPAEERRMFAANES